LTKPISPENATGLISRVAHVNNKSINDAALVQAHSRMEQLLGANEKCDEMGFII